MDPSALLQSLHQFYISENQLDLDMNPSGLLGTGAFGEVRQASLTRTGTSTTILVAHKSLHFLNMDAAQTLVLRHDERQAILSEVLKECYTLSKLNRPNIVGFIGLAVRQREDGGDEAAGIVMELLDPGSLELLLYNPRYQWARTSAGVLEGSVVLQILQGIYEGLEYLHEQNIIHRDIKPLNILITVTEEPIEGDFDLTTTIATASPSSSSHRRLVIKEVKLGDLGCAQMVQ